MSERLTDCMFCTRTESIVSRTPRVFAQLDDAPIAEGHLLICPSLHYPSLADAPAEITVEIDQLVDALTQVYNKVYGPSVIFEHGRTGHCVRRNPGERICHHAHLHMLPLDGELGELIDIGQRVPFQSLSEVAELAGDIEGYILTGSSASGRYFYPVTRPLESHYLRTVAATMSGDVALADWEELLGTERSGRLKRQAASRLALYAAELAPVVSQRV